MAAINTLIKEINHKVRQEHLEEAFALYNEILKDNREYWKIKIIKYLLEFSLDKDFKYMFSQKISDLFILDTKNKQILLVWISSLDFSVDEHRDLYQWLDRTRQSIEEESLVEFGYSVNMIHIVNSSDAEVLNDYSFENEHFYRTIPTRINLELFSPKSTTHIIPENESFDDLVEFCFDMAYGLADMNPDKQVKKTPQSSLDAEQEEMNENEIVVSPFDIIETAPESFVSFLRNNQRAMESIGIKDMFNLSLNSVFAGDELSKTDELVKHFVSSLVPEGQLLTGVDVVYYDILDIPDLKTLKKYLNDLDSTIVVIENMEERLNPYSNFTKQQIIRILCKELDNNQENAFILKTSKKGWKDLVAEFPLLRVFFQNIFEFDSLNVDVLLNHFKAELKMYKLSIHDKAVDLVRDFFQYTKQSKKLELFNFSMSTMLAKEARYYQAVRISQHKYDIASIVSREDIENAIKDEYVFDAKRSLTEVMAKVDRLTGLDPVKTQIRDIAALVKLNQLRKTRSKTVTPISLNTLFVGNPGTGKTTVAKYLGEMYKSIGALQEGHVVAVSRQDIVGKWIGHTEDNMVQLIKKAHGGILFIDEAYSLFLEDTDRDFGRDAINVLVDRLEEIREHTCVILSGYPEPMKRFMKSNPGLASRFPTTIEFTDYSSDELGQILMNFVHSEHFYMAKETTEQLSKYIVKLAQNKGEQFGNGRTCRNLFERLKLIQARRIAYSETNEGADLNLFTMEDVNMLLKELENKQDNPRRRMGYRIGASE